MNKILLTIAETMEILGVSRSKAYELANRRDFPSVRIDSKLMINYPRLLEWIDKQTGGAEVDGRYAG